MSEKIQSRCQADIFVYKEKLDYGEFDRPQTDNIPNKAAIWCEECSIDTIIPNEEFDKTVTELSAQDYIASKCELKKIELEGYEI